MLEILTKNDIQNLIKEVLSLKEMVAEVQAPERKEWLTEEEAMNYLKISKSTIQRYRRDGLLHFSQYQKQIWYKYEDINEFLLESYTGRSIQSRKKIGSW